MGWATATAAVVAGSLLAGGCAGEPKVTIKTTPPEPIPVPEATAAASAAAEPTVLTSSAEPCPPGECGATDADAGPDADGGGVVEDGGVADAAE